MDLFSRLVQQIGFSLGLLAYGESILFSGPVVLPVNSSLYEIETRLENAITEDLTGLIESSTQVGIRFYFKAYSEDNLIYRYYLSKTLLYRSITEEFVLEVNQEQQVFLDPLEALENLVSFQHSMEFQNPRYFILEAELLIPDIEDQDLIDGIWMNQQPRLRYTFGVTP